MAASNSERIETWAAIGSYIGRDARSARRYERSGGLPVHRLPGGGTVYALRSELDSWMTSGRARPTDPPPASAAAPPVADRGWSRLRLPTGAVLAAGVTLAVVLLLGLLLLRPLAPRPSSGSPQARALYRDGLYAWSRRTPEGLARAIDAFTQAVVNDPGYAPAYAGLADAYDLAPEFGRLSPAQAYPRAKGAAERALALDPSLAAAHRALAFVEFWWEGRIPEAMAEFRRALQLDPLSAQTHHWYANALTARHDPRALGEFDLAMASGPSTPVMADRAWALVMLGRPADAREALAELRRLDPSYPAASATDILVAKRLGRDAEMLDTMRRWARVRGDPEGVRTVDRLRTLYASGGRTALRQGLAEREKALLAAGRGDAFTAAAAEAVRGNDEAAIALLLRAKAEHSPIMLSLAFNPDFAALRSDPRFVSLLQ